MPVWVIVVVLSRPAVQLEKSAQSHTSSVAVVARPFVTFLGPVSVEFQEMQAVVLGGPLTLVQVDCQETESFPALRVTQDGTPPISRVIFNLTLPSFLYLKIAVPEVWAELDSLFCMVAFIIVMVVEVELKRIPGVELVT